MEITTIGAARIFLRFRCGGNMGDNVAQDLAELIDEFCKQSASHVIEVAKAKYKELHSGGCRMYSQGENCKCFLCQMDNYRHIVDTTSEAETID